MRIDSIQQSMATDPKAAGDKKLKEACRNLEGVFLGYLLKSMRKTISKADLFGSAKDEEFFQDMMDSEICSSATKSQPMGIADLLYRQLSTNTEPIESRGKQR